MDIIYIIVIGVLLIGLLIVGILFAMHECEKCEECDALKCEKICDNLNECEPCSSPVATPLLTRYVTLKHIPAVPKEKRLLNISEVQILDSSGVNIAPTATITSSKTSDETQFGAKNLVDGNLTSKDSKNVYSFFHTTDDTESPFVTFDLGSEKKLSGINIYNRTDCCKDRIKDVNVLCTSDNGTLVHAFILDSDALEFKLKSKDLIDGVTSAGGTTTSVKS